MSEKHHPPRDNPPRPRAPCGWESVAEQRIQDAMARGEFDHLPGTGKPIEGLDAPHDDNWWIKQLAEREGLTILPTSRGPHPSPRTPRRKALLQVMTDRIMRDHLPRTSRAR